MAQDALARRERSIRVHLREGMEAALKAEPRALANTETRTLLGRVVRELGLEAGRGKTPAIKLMLQLIDWKEPQVPEQRTSAANDDEQGVISSFEPEWDWDRTGKWETAREAAPETESPAEDENNGAAVKTQKEILKLALREKLSRLHAVQLAEHERPAGPRVSPAISGNFASPDAADAEAAARNGQGSWP